MALVNSITAGLTTEFDSTTRQPKGAVTVERYFPNWTDILTGLSSGKNEQYAHGHAAVVYKNGAGAGEDILLRARSGSYASPNNGTLYIAVLSGSELNDPSTWDSQWTATSITGLMYPAWTADSGAAFGGSIDAVTWLNGSTPMARVFYTKSNGSIRYVDVNLSTGSAGSEVTVATIATTNQQLSTMQIAACKYDEVFVLSTELLESGQAAWHKPVYGTMIRRYYYSGSWQYDSTFHHLTHAEAGLFRDGPNQGDVFTGMTNFTNQWGKRVCGGLAASQIDANTVLVSLGMVFWRRWGYEVHSHGVMSFLYHRDSGWWDRGPEISQSDFTEYDFLDVNCLVRGFVSGGGNFISFVRLQEPSDYRQVNGSLSLPRVTETVYAKVSDDGRHYTQFLYLGEADNFAGARICEVTHAGATKLYGLGWRSITESPAAGFLSTAAAVDVSQYINSVTATRSSRKQMGVDFTLADPTPLFDAANPLKPGSLVKFYYGNQTDQLLTAQGFIDVNSPSISASPDGQLTHSAPITCRADDLLLNTRSEDVEDFLPQTTITLDEEGKSVSFSRGLWVPAAMEWPSLFFGSTYSNLQGKAAWRLLSSPYANTGGAGGYGDPGKILNERAEYKGSWFKDITWLAMPPMVDGMIQASVRFGDVYNQGNFNFKAGSGERTYVTPNRSNGVITTVNWRTGSYGGSIWNTVAQYACMAGLLFHAPEVGKKYAFVWEHNSNFLVSSHTDDRWKNENFDLADYSAHGTGSNRLYLIMSDFDGSNWINKSVAGITATGLTPGQPADLRVHISGGTIHCFYRPWSNGTPNQWQYAFSYKAGRFGAGQFGLVGRGGAGIQWDILYPGAAYIRKLENYVDFWDVRCSDGVRDTTLGEHIKRYTWRGFTPANMNLLVNQASRAVSSGSTYAFSEPVENLTIDFKLSLGSGGEAGVYLRGVSSGSPTQNCIRLGLVPSSTAYAATSQISYHVVKRLYAGGSEQSASREYSPVTARPYSPSVPVPVRITARGALYTVWIAGNYAGHFVDETPLGLYFGLYCSSGSATFTDIKVSELFEVTGSALLEPGQAMSEALDRLLGNRKVKAIYNPDGSLTFGYYDTRASGPAQDGARLWQASLNRNSRYVSKVRVEGAAAYAVYQANSLARKGQRYHTVTNKEITLREFAYREAKAIVRETAENQVKATFTGLPDPRLNPEDTTEIYIPQQSVNGEFVIEDVRITLNAGDTPSSSMTLAVRQTVAL